VSVSQLVSDLQHRLPVSLVGLQSDVHSLISDSSSSIATEAGERKQRCWYCSG